MDKENNGKESEKDRKHRKRVESYIEGARERARCLERQKRAKIEARNQREEQEQREKEAEDRRRQERNRLFWGNWIESEKTGKGKTGTGLLEK